MNPSAQDNNELAALKNLILSKNLPSDLAEKLNAQVARIEKNIVLAGFKPEFEREIEYIKFSASLPWSQSSQDILDLKRTEGILDKNHYGLQPVKERILEYLSMLILNLKQGQKSKAPILAFVGLVGSGKTSLAYSIAESLGRKIIRIPFGGFGSVRELRGKSRIETDGEPGLILKSIQNCGTNNPVILLDEIDRVAGEARADVMGVLVELLDPEQNWAFVDKYVDYPFDLSKVLFIATANNTGNIATAVLDRLEMIEMPAYTDDEKITIGRSFILPKALVEAGLSGNTVIINETVWPKIVRPLGFDAGIRSLQRTIQGVVRKIAKEVVEGTPGPYNLTEENIGKYL